jgi:hypothetical protein
MYFGVLGVSQGLDMETGSIITATTIPTFPNEPAEPSQPRRTRLTAPEARIDFKLGAIGNDYALTIAGGPEDKRSPSQILASFLEESGNTLDGLKNGLFHEYVDSCSAGRTQPNPIHVRLIQTLDSSGHSILSSDDVRKLFGS